MNSDDCVLINPKKIKQEPMETVTTNSDDCVLIDQKKIKQEPMETVILLEDDCNPMDRNNMQKAPAEPNIQIKIEDLKQERIDQYEPKLDRINEDMLQYEPREGLTAKIKVEPGPQGDCMPNDITEQPSFNKIKTEVVNYSDNVKTEKVLQHEPGKALPTKIKEELSPENDRMLIDSEQSPAFSDEMAANTCTANNDTSGNKISVLTANDRTESGTPSQAKDTKSTLLRNEVDLVSLDYEDESGAETWEPIPVRKVDHYFGENDGKPGGNTHQTDRREHIPIRAQVTNKVTEPVNGQSQ